MAELAGIFEVAIALFILIAFATAILPTLAAMNILSAVIYVILMGILIVGIVIKFLEGF